MLTDYQLQLPKIVYGGTHGLEKIRDIMANYDGKVAVFTDRGIVNAGLLAYPLSLLGECKKEVVLFQDLPAEPTCDQAQEVVNQFQAAGASFIMAVGGGSVMDIAKLASVLAGNECGVRELLDQPGLGKKTVPTLMIPTTAGTGAEATPNSIVAVPEKDLKVGIVNMQMIADYVILDGRMIKNLPRAIAAATGVDALAHAIECFTSKKSNPFSDLFALEALELIFNHIEQACDNPEALDAKTAMLTASFYAGAAITASGTTAVHALSYPLGGRYHIPHGVANAMMLAPVMRFNEPECRQQFVKVYDRIVKETSVEKDGEKNCADGDLTNKNCAETGNADKMTGLPMTDEEKSAWIIRRLEEIVKHLGIPTSLKDYGIGAENLDDLVAAGMDVTRLLVNNRRTVTAQDARKLYMEIM